MGARSAGGTAAARDHERWGVPISGSSGTLAEVPGRTRVRQRPPRAKGFVFITLEDEDGVANAAARADRTGMYCCPRTGAAPAVLAKLRSGGVIKPSDRVVVISTTHGLKFTRSKVGYHEQTLEDVAALHANPPLELPADHTVVSEAIDQFSPHAWG